MLEMFEHAVAENQLVAAFAVVGIIVWVSNFLAHHVTRGRVHGSADGSARTLSIHRVTGAVQC